MTITINGKPFTDAQLALAAHVAQLKETIASLETFIQSQPDLSVFVIADYQEMVETARDAVELLACETCDEPMSTVLGQMKLCAACRQNWHVCERCQEPVRHADAVWEDTRVPLFKGMGSTYESRPYHGPCASGPIAKWDGI